MENKKTNSDNIIDGSKTCDVNMTHDASATNAEVKASCDALLKKIIAEDVKMRPKAFFTLKVIALAVVSVLTLVTTVLLFSFVLFSVRASGEMLLLGFGWRGLLIFLTLFPWTTLLIEILLIAALEWLLRQFKFGYRSPVAFLTMAILLLTVALSLFVERGTTLHESLLYQSDKDTLPIIGTFYKEIRQHPDSRELCRCVITDVGNTTITVVADDRDFYATSSHHVVLLPAGIATSSLGRGDRVLIIEENYGDDNKQIRAFRMKKVVAGEIPGRNDRESHRNQEERLKTKAEAR